MNPRTVALVMPRSGPTLLFAPFNYMALAHDLKSRGYRPLVVDCRLQDPVPVLRREHDRGTLAAVGLTSMMGPQLSYAIDVGMFVRRTMPDVPVIWGGILPTELPELVASHPSCSYVVLSWGEGRFASLLDCLAAGEEPISVPGLVWRDRSGTLQRSEAPPVHDHPPLVYDWSSVDIEPFLLTGYGLGRRTLVMITSRGCPHQCSFCYGPQFHGSTWTAQPAEQVLADIDHLRRSHSFDSIFFNDDNFAVKWSRTVAIAEGLRARGLRFGLSFHASYLDDDRIRFLKEHGAVRLYWGPESGSQRILDILGKGVTPDMNLRIAESARRHDLGALMGFMVGHPRETEGDLEATLDHIDALMAIHPGLDISDVKIYTPYPGTAFYDEAVAHGFVPPARLEDWATYYWNKANLPWLSLAQQRRLETISYTSLCAFASWRTAGLNPLQKQVTRALRPIERWRWRRRQFDRAPELRLLKAYVDLHRLDESGGRRTWNSIRGIADRFGLR